MLVRICLIAFVLSPCFSGCAFAPPETVSTPALEKWAAEHPELRKAARKPNPGASNTERWMEAQKHSASFDQALKAWQSDDTVACRRILLQVLQANPQHRDSLLLMAQLEMLDRRPGSIQPALTAYCDANTADPSAQHMLGLVYESMGEQRAALARYRKAVALAPENLAFQASVDGLLNPHQSTLAPEEERQEPSRPDLLASGNTTNGLTISEPLEFTTTVGPRRRIVDDYSDESTNTADMLAATQGALKTHENATSSIQEAIVARNRGRGHELAQMFASTQVNDIGRPFGAAAEDANIQIAKHDVASQLAARSGDSRSAGTAALSAGEFNIQQASATMPADAAAQTTDLDTEILTRVVELVRTGKPQAGLQLLQSNGSLERSARYFRIYGMAQFESGDAQGASVSLLRSLSLDDTSALSYFLMGTSLSQLGQEAEAEGYFRQAAILDPRFSRSSSAGS